MVWLRLCVYERVGSHATVATYAISSVWHGFYPGYYLTFAGGAFFTICARKARRCLRPLVLTHGGKTGKVFYDFLTWAVTHVVLAYITFPFVMLKLPPSIMVYK